MSEVMKGYLTGEDRRRIIKGLDAYRLTLVGHLGGANSEASRTILGKEISEVEKLIKRLQEAR